MQGLVSSIQSLGAVGGPGIRCVVFMQGCTLRCVYCHNPETWDIGKNGFLYSPKELYDKVVKYKPYFGCDGGITVSGGEPLIQAEFLTEFFKLLKDNGIHTALDTAGVISDENVSQLLDFTDLVLMDLKFASEDEYKLYCKGSLKSAETFMDLTESKNIPVWIRHVVVPGIDDNIEDIKKIKNIAQKYKNVQKS